MYIREIQPPRSSPIEKGIPLQGTWTNSFESVDLLSVERPFSFPWRKWAVDKRIKEWQTFVIQNENYSIVAVLANLKHYCWAQVLLYDKEAKKTLRFRKLVPFNGWRMPTTLSNASIDSRAYGFFFRIHNWLDANTIRVDLDIEATRTRPSFTAHLKYDIDRNAITPMAVSLLFNGRNSMYAYKAIAPVRADMVLNGRHIALQPDTTTGYFGDFKGYYPYRMRSRWCTACTVDKQGRYGFSIAENQARASFKNNENALWLNGQLTPLPPVHITTGPGADWIIQDMEGMVDLVFTPEVPVHNTLNIVLSKAEYHTPLGYFNGMLLDTQGSRVEVHNLWGLGENLYVRV
ncbi:MAG: DUF2804 domain-containing protein [Treponema sp.]|jgi:hypothetical protein|nr:DUF2804 domain-containing protein [Treponema sp.]